MKARIEQTEVEGWKPTSTPTNKKDSQKGSSYNLKAPIPKKKKGNGEGKHYCLFHGHNNTHVSDDCYALKKQAEELQQKKGKTKSSSYSKSKSTGVDKQELHAMIAEAVAKTLAGKSKKRKL